MNVNINLWETIVKTRLKTNRNIYTNDLVPSIDSLKDTVNDLRNHWKGSDIDYFIEKIEPFLEDLESLKTSLDTYHNYIEGYLNAITKLNKAFSEKTISLK